jgi:hypothetical protein
METGVGMSVILLTAHLIQVSWALAIFSTIF